MKRVVVTIAAAVLVSACVSTPSGQQLASNACSSPDTEGQGFSCGQNAALSPDALHARVSAESRSRNSQGRN